MSLNLDALALCRRAASSPSAEARSLYTRALTQDPECVEALCGLAALLQANGDLDGAIQHYRRALVRDPTNAIAANNMGNALQMVGRLEDAVASYRTALTSRPDSAEIRTNLGRALDSSGRPREAIEEFGKALALSPQSAEIHWRIGAVLENIPFPADARLYYQKAIALDPNCAPAHTGLGNILADFGLEEQAWHHWQQGYAGRVLTTRPAVGNDNPIRILKLISAAGGNIPVDDVLVPTQFQVSTLVAELADHLPHRDEYDAIFNAIGDADRCRRGLEAATDLLQNCARVLNPPDRILQTGRKAISERLASIPDVRVARVVTLPRSAFESEKAMSTLVENGWSCPFLLRVLGHHAGHHFIRIDSMEQLNRDALTLPGGEITAIEWLDAQGTDGMFRKYRVMCIGGNLYPLHLALSKHWKVHYFSANMAEDEQYRAEEREFLSNFPDVVGKKGMAALHAIQDALSLDYAGLDFAVAQSGELLLFEANATMRITRPPENSVWDYRRPFVESALSAARDLFAPRARIGKAG